MGVVVERQPARKPPLVSLPKRDPSIQIFTEVAAGVAGCCICNRPIPANQHRLRFSVKPHFPATSGAGEENYFAHPKCLTEGISTIPRHGVGCWDCGREPEGSFRWENFCFTVSRTNWGALCDKCSKRARWERCGLCSIFYPVHMVDDVGLHPDPNEDEEDSLAAIARDMSLPTAQRACVHCLKRYGLETITAVKERNREVELERQEERARFNRIRRQLGGVDATSASGSKHEG